MTEITLHFDKKIDFLTYQLKQQFYNLSENELKLIAILYLAGISNEIKKQILDLKVFKSMQSIENHLTKLRKLGIIQNNKIVLKKDISTKNTVIKINLILGADKKNS
jgi:hypothetical protein